MNNIQYMFVNGLFLVIYLTVYEIVTLTEQEAD
jgi:uncharacterized membrane protein YjfL (UPF0719 family)